MTVGLSAGNFANDCLDVLSGTTFTAPANTFAKLHTGDPGSAGTTAPSLETTRKQLTWSAASAGSKAITTTLPVWTSWPAPANAELISHVSVWDASTAGNFLYSFVLTTPKTLNTGDSATLSSHSISLTPIAA